MLRDISNLLVAGGQTLLPSLGRVRERAQRGASQIWLVRQSAASGVGRDGPSSLLPAAVPPQKHAMEARLLLYLPLVLSEV